MDKKWTKIIVIVLLVILSISILVDRIYPFLDLSLKQCFTTVIICLSFILIILFKNEKNSKK